MHNLESLHTATQSTTHITPHHISVVVTTQYLTSSLFATTTSKPPNFQTSKPPSLQTSISSSIIIRTESNPIMNPRHHHRHFCATSARNHELALTQWQETREAAEVAIAQRLHRHELEFARRFKARACAWDKRAQQQQAAWDRWGQHQKTSWEKWGEEQSHSWEKWGSDLGKSWGKRGNSFGKSWEKRGQNLGRSCGRWGENFGRKCERWGDGVGKRCERWGSDAGCSWDRCECGKNHTAWVVEANDGRARYTRAQELGFLRPEEPEEPQEPQEAEVYSEALTTDEPSYIDEDEDLDRRGPPPPYTP